MPEKNLVPLDTLKESPLTPLTNLVKAWVNESSGWFSYSQMDSDLNIKSREAKTLRRVIMKELVDAKVIERASGKNGVFRAFQTELHEIDWQNADSSKVLDLTFPFDLQNYVKIFPKSIIVLAGESNSGKTAFLYNFIMTNYAKQSIDLYNSETAAEQMKERFENFETEIPVPPPWNTYERYDNFADVINPNHISVIDYIDFSSEVYLIGEELNNLFKKLDRGIVIAAIQKKGSYMMKGQKITPKLGYGAEMSLKKSSLYLSMGFGTLEIVKGKSWKDPTINPSGLKWTFNLLKGAKFVNIQSAGLPEE